MKALIFLVVLALAIAALVWHLRKSQAEEALARRDSLERRKKQDKEKITPEMDMIWPVVVRPVTGKRPPGEEPEAHEPSMTSIDFESADEVASGQSG